MNMKQFTMTLSLCTALLFVWGLTELKAQSSSQSDEKVVVVPNRPSVSELRIRGRIQGQYANSSGNNSNAGIDADSYSSFEMRRIRLGVQGRLYSDFNFLVEVNALSTVGLDAATLTYNAIPQANITFGKAKPIFGHEQNTSSASILTFERTQLDSFMNGGKPIGFRVHGRMDLFHYYLGVYNGQNVSTGRMSSEQDSYLYNASIGLNLGRLIGDNTRADFRADYLHSTDESGFYNFENAYAVSGHIGFGDFDLRAEYMTGETHEGESLNGFYILPSYFLVPGKFQAVFRYENVSADSGISIGHNRYADRSPNLYGAGNEYNAIYGGINYYVHGHNLKFMLGVEVANNSNDVNNTEGTATTIFTGFRMQF